MRRILFTIGALAALSISTAPAASADSTCVNVASPRVNWAWSESVPVTAGASFTVEGSVSDSYENRAATGYQVEKFKVGDRETPELADGVDSATEKFAWAGTWAGGEFLVSHVSGSLSVDVTICWTDPAPETTVAASTSTEAVTTVSEAPMTTAPPTTAPRPSEGPCLENGTVLIDCPAVTYATTTVAATTSSQEPVPPTVAPSSSVAGVTVTNESTDDVTVDTLPATGANNTPLIAAGVVFLLFGGLATAGAHRRPVR